MLDDLGDDIDRIEDRMIRETGHVVTVTENAKSGGTLASFPLAIVHTCAL